MENAYVLQLSNHKFRDLYLCSCGYAKCGPLHSFGPAVRPHYILHYILEGKGRYYVGDTQYELQAGSGFLIEPEVQTFYQADQEDPWIYLWIGFGGDNAKTYLTDLGLNSGRLTFRSNHAADLKQTVINMLKNHTANTANQYLLESYLYAFFAILSRDIDVVVTSKSEKENIYIRKAIEYIHDNYTNPIRIADVAHYVCIDRSYLYILFRKHMDMSPQDYLANYRITRAAELLSITDLPIGGVALSCGYTDPLVFSKAFKLRKGSTPSQYRRKSREDTNGHLRQHRDCLENL